MITYTVICNRGFRHPPTRASGAILALGIFHHRVQLHLQLPLLFRRDRRSTIITIPDCHHDPRFRAPIRAILPLCFQATTNASLRITRIFRLLQMPGGYGAAGYLFERFVFQLRLQWTPSKDLLPTTHGAILLPAYWRLEISPRPMERQGLQTLAHARSQATRRFHETLDADRFRSSADGWSCRRR